MKIEDISDSDLDKRKQVNSKRIKILKDENIDEFHLLKSYMEKTGIYEVMLCAGCSFLKISKLGKAGAFCTMGTRKIRKLDGKIVCLDCTENRLEKLTVSKEVFKNLEDNIIVRTTL